MQAQQAAPGGGSSSLLQNKGFLIGLAVAAVVAIGVLIFMMLPKPGPTVASAPPGPGDTPGPAPAGAVSPGGKPTDIDGKPTADTGAAAPVAATGAAAPAPAPGAPAPGGPAAPAATKEAAPKRPPNSRINAFTENSELKRVEESIPVYNAPSEYSPTHSLYAELKPATPPNKTTGEDAGDGPPIPAMRVAAILQGSDRLTAMIQMGSEFMQVRPGQMIPPGNPVYRVNTIEPTKVVLTRKWELGDKKGTQRVEVPLAHGASETSSFGGGTSGYPGGTSGFPGGSPYPGAGGRPGASGFPGGGGSNPRGGRNID